MDTEEEWFLSVSRSYLQTDIFAARCWLLTAKSIFPQKFTLQVNVTTDEFQLYNGCAELIAVFFVNLLMCCLYVLHN